MNKKKKIIIDIILLPPLKLIIGMANINLETLLYKLFKKTKGTICKKTLLNTLKGKQKPSEKTVKEIFEAFPHLKKSKAIRFLFFKEGLPKVQNQWELLLEELHSSLDNYKDRIFPYCQKKLKNLIKIEKSIDRAKNKDTIIREVFDAYKNIDLSDEERSILYAPNYIEEKVEHVFLSSFFPKIILYLASYLDAEFSYNNLKNIKNKLDASIVKALLPSIENYKYKKTIKSKIVGSVEMLFRNWKEKWKTTYSKMQQFIKTSGWKETEKETKRSKFKQWRRGEKVANCEDILNIFKGINRELINKEDRHKAEYSIMIFYHISLFLSNYFRILKCVKDFKTDDEIVFWMHYNYNKFFNEAYLEVKKFYESAKHSS